MSATISPPRRISLPMADVRAIDLVYESLPHIQCKGLCQGACGPIGMTQLEHDRIVKRFGSAPKMLEPRMQCSKLTAQGRCEVYSLRPTICRLYGLVRRMECPHGCVPDRWLSD